MSEMSSTDLPELSGEYLVTAGQRAQYARDGHVLLRGVASPAEAAAYRAAINAAVARHNTETRPLEARDTYGKAFLQIMNLWENDAAARRFVLARRFARIAAELMGVDGVRIYHDQALYKEPGGGLTPWHQDQYYWPLDTDRTVTMWMPLVDVTADMGSMTFASRSHLAGYLGELPISDRSEAVLRQLVAERGYALAESGALSAGDATFHSGWTLHAAPGNRTGRTREVMTVIYFADGARATEPDNPNRQRDLDRWMPGLKPGDLAASPLNPVVFRA
jgi:ectoine hydroxylase-related dioxygenase (phytanoyl-CoA dioxygenase family)